MVAARAKPLFEIEAKERQKATQFGSNRGGKRATTEPGIINRLVVNVQNCQQITEIGGAQCG